jgi:hypothetical protein
MLLRWMECLVLLVLYLSYESWIDTFNRLKVRHDGRRNNREAILSSLGRNIHGMRLIASNYAAALATSPRLHN